MVVGIVLSCSTVAVALPLPNLATASYPLRGESDLNRMGRNSSIDWIVSTTDLVSSAKQSDFRFAFNFSTAAPQGDYATYSGSSSWYYYFQIENWSGNFATSFSLSLDPSVVLTAGYVLGVDLDTDLSLSHLDTDPGLAGEYELPGAQLVDFTSASFDPNPPSPNASLNFALGFGSGKESTLFFISSYTPPQYLISELLTGPQGPEGYVPVPRRFESTVIPEPLTLIMLAVSCGVSFLIRRRSSV